MNKDKQAVLQGLIITLLVVGFLTLLWSIYLHLFPNTWSWLKTTVALLNYSFGLYLGVLSAALRVKTVAIKAPLYVMLIFFVLNVILRLIFVQSNIAYWFVVLKFAYSSVLCILAYRQAKTIMNNKQVYTYSRLS